MQYSSYTVVVTSDDYSSFEFTSTGPRGTITKRVRLMPTNHDLVVSLGFGDVLPDGQVTDKVATNNGDRDKTLATIASIIEIYTTAYPHRWVYIEGSTRARSRLYRMAITANFEELSMRYEIYGYVEGPIMESFSKGQPFYAFLVGRKNP